MPRRIARIQRSSFSGRRIDQSSCSGWLIRSKRGSGAADDGKQRVEVVFARVVMEHAGAEGIPAAECGAGEKDLAAGLDGVHDPAVERIELLVVVPELIGDVAETDD